MSELRVDIVTPSYNQDRFIRDTLESVRNQSYSPVNHIVMDGGSTDDTVSILEEYDDVDWVSEEDRGQTHAINKGFERADAAIVGWLNSDDPLVYRDTVEVVVEAFERTDADILVGHSITIGPDNELLRAHFIPPFSAKRMERICFLFQPSVFFRRHVVEEQKLDEDRDYSMDYEYWLRLAQEEYDWHHVGEILSADRNHQERKIIADADQSRADTRRVREEYGIERTVGYRAAQWYESVDLRARRLRALPLLRELLNAPESRFAFDLDRQPTVSSLATQLFGRKRAL